LNVDLGGTLNSNPVNGSGAFLQGIIGATGGSPNQITSLNDFGYPVGAPVSTTFTSATPSNAFAFNYLFTVSSPQNAQNSFVTQLTSNLSDFGMTLYLGNTANALDVVATSSPPPGGITTGELDLGLANLASNTTYDLVVSGDMLTGKVGSFFGWATVSAVPLPGTLLLFGSSLLGLGGFSGRKRIKTLVSQLSGRFGRVAAVAAMAIAFGLGLVGYAAPASAQTVVDVPLTLSGLPQIVPLENILPVGTGAFDVNFEFTLANPVGVLASISDLHLFVNPTFDLYASGNPNALGPVVATGVIGGGAVTIGEANFGSGNYIAQFAGSVNPDDRGIVSGQLEISAVPVPGALLLFGSGLAGLVGFGLHGRRARKDTAAA
jgi:hypothetical protein